MIRWSSHCNVNTRMIKIPAEGHVTKEEIVGMAMATKTSASTGNIILIPHVKVVYIPTSEVVEILAIGNKSENRECARTEEFGWVELSKLKPIPK